MLDDNVGDVDGCINVTTANISLESSYDSYTGVTGSTVQLNSLRPDRLENGFVEQDLVGQEEFRFPVNETLYLL